MGGLRGELGGGLRTGLRAGLRAGFSGGLGGGLRGGTVPAMVRSSRLFGFPGGGADGSRFAQRGGRGPGGMGRLWISGGKEGRPSLGWPSGPA
ncbi:hypothetical protein GCM10009839_50630 [Catenulispora yoronensis]|uniref:Uncharacterized protein n=1 Tax=Catenulispora yoronensis TaxID=450799 RepID=A0ABP5GA06_9ACTN